MADEISTAKHPKRVVEPPHGKKQGPKQAWDKDHPAPQPETP